MTFALAKKTGLRINQLVGKFVCTNFYKRLYLFLCFLLF